MTKLTKLLIASAALVCSVLPALATGRQALVIGIDRYGEQVPEAQLTRAVSDARAVRDTLKDKLGFEVVYGENVTLKEAESLLWVLVRRLNPGDIVFVFFAGHGIHLRGANYLLPSDLPKLRAASTPNRQRMEEEFVIDNAMSETRIRDKIGMQHASVAIVVIDACRNPLFRIPGGSDEDLRKRAVGNATELGPRPIKRDIGGVTGFYLLYSASAGQQALDSLGKSDVQPNSPFTRVFLTKLAEPGRSVNAIMRGTRDEVAKLARGVGHDQVPAYAEEAVLGDLVLTGNTTTPQFLVPPVPRTPAMELDEAGRVWLTISGTSSMAMLETFIAKYGESPYAPMARARLDELRRTRVRSPSPGEDTKPPSAKDREARAAAPPPSGIRAPDAAPRTERPPAPAAPVPPVIGPPGRVGAPTPASSSEPRGCEGIRIRVGKGERCVKPGAGEAFRDCDTCPRMVLIPSGSTMMGSTDQEVQARKANADEMPQRHITFKEPFAIGRTEVTVVEYSRCVSAGACRLPEWAEHGSPVNAKTGTADDYRKLGAALTGGNQPIVGVSWQDAKDFVRWMSMATGLNYRLPTESEWEYVARSGTTARRYWWGEEPSPGYAHYAGADRRLPFTGPVARLQPTPWGVYDIFGNVAEWVEDCAADDLSRVPTDGTAHGGTGCSDQRTIRGGSWYDDAENLRLTMRDRDLPTQRWNLLGFRIARTLAPPF